MYKCLDHGIYGIYVLLEWDCCVLVLISVKFLCVMQVCPICEKKVGTDLVGHITTQHENLLKISFAYTFHLKIDLEFILMNLHL